MFVKFVKYNKLLTMFTIVYNIQNVKLSNQS